jgi:mannose-6-phosphate isomerase-like protein (cupin superfamily)
LLSLEENSRLFECSIKTATKMTDSRSEKSSSLVYSPQSRDLRPANKYLTSLSLHLDEYCVLTAEMPADAIIPLHSHADRETFYILSGEMNFYDGAYRNRENWLTCLTM